MPDLSIGTRSAADGHMWTHLLPTLLDSIHAVQLCHRGFEVGQRSKMEKMPHLRGHRLPTRGSAGTILCWPGKPLASTRGRCRLAINGKKGSLYDGTSPGRRHRVAKFRW